MNVVCLDMEGVLTPEIWIAFSENTGIKELRRTTREEPDYMKLMRYRMDILREHGLGLKEIQDVIATIDPLPGAKEFLDELRSLTQVIILSDTFEEFAKPLMAKLGWPTIFCNALEIDEDGMVAGVHMRCPESKLTTVRGLQSIGFETIAMGILGLITVFLPPVAATVWLMLLIPYTVIAAIYSIKVERTG